MPGFAEIRRAVHGILWKIKACKTRQMGESYGDLRHNYGGHFSCCGCKRQGSFSKADRTGYQQKEEELTRKVQDEENRTKELEEYKVYVQTKQYAEEVAKEKLGLVNPDEILLKPKQ